MPLPPLLYSNAFTGSFDAGSALGAKAGMWIGADIDVPPKPLSGKMPLAMPPTAMLSRSAVGA